MTAAEKIRQRAMLARKKQLAEAKEAENLAKMKNGTLDPESEGWEGYGSKAAGGYQLPDSFDEMGLRAARVIQAFAKTAKDNGGQPNSFDVPKVLSDTYAEKSLSRLVEKDYELLKPENGGMFKMPEMLWNEFVPYLRAHAPLLALGARVLTMKGGNLHIPGMANGNSAEYMGEKSETITTSTTFNDIKMDSKKLGTKTVISYDLLEETSVDILEKIREDLVDCMGEKMTYQGIYGLGTKYAPAGLLQDDGITTIDHGGNPWTSDLGLAGLEVLWNNNINVNPSECGWMFNPTLWRSITTQITTTGDFLFLEEMMKNKSHLGTPFEIYNGIPVTATAPNKRTNALFGLWREFIIGVGRELTVQTSSEAAFRNEAGQMVSAWDIEAVLIRLTHKHDFAIRRPKAFVNITNIAV